jgi:hypothetical protein
MSEYQNYNSYFSSNAFIVNSYLPVNLRIANI